MSQEKVVNINTGLGGSTPGCQVCAYKDIIIDGHRYSVGFDYEGNDNIRVIVKNYDGSKGVISCEAVVSMQDVYDIVNMKGIVEYIKELINIARMQRDNAKDIANQLEKWDGKLD